MTKETSEQGDVLPMGKMPPRWFEDWELGITGFDDGTALIEVTLPHSAPSRYVFRGQKGQDLRSMTNLLDRLLSELTGTKVKKIIKNGPDTEPSA